MRPATVMVTNFLGWPIFQLAIARIFILLPERFFTADSVRYRVGASERMFYRNTLKIRRWKHLLPDGGRWVGSDFPKRNLQSRDAAYLHRFRLETKRAETAHLAAILCSPIFFLWTPMRAWSAILLFAAAINLPCILVQRYNRSARPISSSAKLLSREDRRTTDSNLRSDAS